MIKNYTVFLVLLLLCADIFCLPSVDDISSSISDAWQQLMTAIKKPARMKRGRNARRRLNKLKLKNTTTTTTTTTTIETPTTSVSVFLKKLSLPVLPHPQWMSLNSWKMPQQPGIGILLHMPQSLGVKPHMEPTRWLNLNLSRFNNHSQRKLILPVLPDAGWRRFGGSRLSHGVLGNFTGLYS